MKKFFCILLLAPLSLLAQKKPGFVVTGNIAGIADGEVKITSTQHPDSVIAKTTSKSGVFTLKGAIPEPGLYLVNLKGEKPKYIFLENNPIAITGTKKEINNLTVKGSQSHLDFLQFNEIFNPLIGSLNAVVAQLQNPANQSRQAFYMQQYDSIIAKIDTEVDRFITQKGSSYVSPFLLIVTAQVSDNPMRMEERYNRLDEKIRTSGIGRSLAELIAYNKIGSVGTPATDFTQNDVSNKPVSLSSFKGKYVLLDFWASWCGPCRAENPNVVAAYNKFKEKNFTVLSVSLDKEKAAWQKAIAADGLTWTHVSDLGYWQNAVAVQYHIQSIPQNFLLDPSGVIIGKNLRGEELQNKLCEVLGCN